MASFTSSAGSKRIRPWDSCLDVEKLKEMLEERQIELESFELKGSMEQNMDTVHRLEEMLHQRDRHIEQLLLELKEVKSLSPSREDSSNPSMKLTRDALKTKSSSKPSIDTGKVAFVHRNASRKGRHVTTNTQHDADDHEDEGIANDADKGDEDYIEKIVAADSTEDDDDDDDDGETTFGKPKSVRRNANGKRVKVSAKNGEFPLFGTQSAVNVDPSKLRASIRNQIMKQMVYRQGLKYSKSKAVAEVPNLSEGHVRAIVGDDLFPKGKRRGKMIRVNANKDVVSELFGGFTKGLRYGAVLDLIDGLKFAFARDTGILKVTGTFTMY